MPNPRYPDLSRRQQEQLRDPERYRRRRAKAPPADPQIQRRFEYLRNAGRTDQLLKELAEYQRIRKESQYGRKQKPTQAR